MKIVTSKKIAILSAGLMLLASPLAAETLSEKTGVNSALDIAPSTADFVTEAAVGDLFDIQSSKLAEARGDAATKAFAEKMIADHTKTSSELMPLAMAANVPVPTEMDGTHKTLLGKLQALQGGDFARAYHDDQAKAHKQAVSLFERYAKGGDNSGLKTFANATLPTLREHEKMADNMDK